MTVLSTLKTAATAAAITIGLAATALAPAPAVAQSFGFSFGNDNAQLRFRIGDDDDFRRCVSLRNLDDRIEDQGYRRVRITDYGRRVTEATGIRGSWRYALLVNSCTGRVIDRDRLRRV